ncbi:eukaryotic peptide chain release factor GTP-binding subunit ERF3A [Trifolium repens]|nr:eukaryotic peptide chain release factor GTP-binding subunit ERF3A [Trifolium repens]
MHRTMPTNLSIFFYAGKSTTGGQILFLSGQVDDRTIQKYEKEANDKSRESWLQMLLVPRPNEFSKSTH